MARIKSYGLAAGIIVGIGLVLALSQHLSRTPLLTSGEVFYNLGIILISIGIFAGICLIIWARSRSTRN